MLQSLRSGSARLMPSLASLSSISSSSVVVRQAATTAARRGYASKPVPNVSKSNELPIETPHRDAPISESAEKGEEMRVKQAPNREVTWSRSQKPRSEAMSGPRFEQTIMEYQPAPQAAIELVHKQPVRWTHSKVVECDGGGGPLGHPRIFINTDKPQICWCTYCGIPFANEHHRSHLETLPTTSYPLTPQGHEAEINESQRITDEALGHR